MLSKEDVSKVEGGFWKLNFRSAFMCTLFQGVTLAEMREATQHLGGLSFSVKI